MTDEESAELRQQLDDRWKVYTDRLREIEALTREIDQERRAGKLVVTLIVFAACVPLLFAMAVIFGFWLGRGWQ